MSTTVSQKKEAVKSAKAILRSFYLTACKEVVKPNMDNLHFICDDFDLHFISKKGGAQ
ncbi:hypothetical protein [Dysgonomonas sp. 521]|uniref:hypothetical protein n=1 Tax=Dysgonomonas sp. 521 TaxID=2302932 RepID=UPI0013D84A75|nr:hypothetical protein [Dysgonomonas sp. 521]